jgi:hypothetical protein
VDATAVGMADVVAVAVVTAVVVEDPAVRAGQAVPADADAVEDPAVAGAAAAGVVGVVPEVPADAFS